MGGLTEVDLDGRNLGLDVVNDGRDVVTRATSNDGGTRVDRRRGRCEPGEGSGGGKKNGPEGRHFCAEC